MSLLVFCFRYLGLMLFTGYGLWPFVLTVLMDWFVSLGHHRLGGLGLVLYASNRLKVQVLEDLLYWFLDISLGLYVLSLLNAGSF